MCAEWQYGNLNGFSPAFSFTIYISILEIMLLVLFYALSTVGMVIPRAGLTTFPIQEQNVNIFNQLVNSSAVLLSSACQLPSSLGLIGADHLIAINSKQLISFPTGSSLCGMCVSITYGGAAPIMAVVVDECTNCADGSIAVSPTIYQQMLALSSFPNFTQITPVSISWSEVSCPVKVGSIPTMSLTWSQISASFSPLQVYGLPFPATQILVTWDAYDIRQVTSASWIQLILPSALVSASPKQLGYWSLPDGVASSKIISGPIGIRVNMRDGTILVTTAQNVNFGQDNGDVNVGLWIANGLLKNAVIAQTALGNGRTRKRDDLSLMNATILSTPDFGV